MTEPTTTSPKPPATVEFPAPDLWKRLAPDKLIDGPWAEFRHAQLEKFLKALVRGAAFPIKLDTIGSSGEGRALSTLRFGNPQGRRVLVWARQHGDEPDCTAALCLALDELVRRATTPLARVILEQLDILVFPMVNPDGVARFTRENAHGIDINRDAAARATSEGAALFALKEKFAPDFCFNLHDMSPRKARADGPLVTLAFQAGPFCESDVDNEVRLRAKSVAALMERECRPWAPDGLARYEADYMPRAFGDSMMRWGVSSILIEAGGARGDDGDAFVQRLFTVAFLRGLHAVAQREDSLEGAAYDAILLDSSKRFADLVVEGAMIENGSGAAAFRADLHIDFLARASGPDAPVMTTGAIQNLGDFEDQPAKARLDARELIVFPGFTVFAPDIDVGRLASHEISADFLAAGVTTIACGAGPFVSDSDRAKWAREAPDTPPSPNVAAFEIVSNLDEIRARHGITELAGFLVRNLITHAGDFLQFARLFDPATNFVLDRSKAGLVSLDMYFVPAPAPGAARMHIVAQPASVDGTGERTTQEELRRFAAEFLRGPSQVSLACDPVRDSMEWFPLPVDCSGHLDSNPPVPEFFGRLITLSSGTDRGAISSIMTMLASRAAEALRLDGIGMIQRDARADLVAFRLGPIARGDAEALENLSPEFVLLNGAPAFDRHKKIARALAGRWFFAHERER